MNDIKKLIEEISSRKPKNYQQMKIEEVSKELHNTMEFEQNVLKKINSQAKNLYFTCVFSHNLEQFHFKKMNQFN